jgi:hypothetical protein
MHPPFDVPTHICYSLILFVWHAFCPSAAGCERSASIRKTADAIVLTHTPAVAQAIIDQAIALWAGCPNYGVDFPRFFNGHSEERYGNARVVEIRFGGNNKLDRSCAYFQGQRIVLYAATLSELGTPVACSRPAANLAHELGHVLGLRHPPSQSLRDGIMGPALLLEKSPRRVRPHECARAGAIWLTSAEVALGLPTETEDPLAGPESTRELSLRGVSHGRAVDLRSRSLCRAFKGRHGSKPSTSFILSSSPGSAGVIATSDTRRPIAESQLVRLEEP